MKRLLTTLAGLLLSVSAVAAPPLLSPAELQAKLTDPNLRVIDIRDPKSYAASHIPGALNAPYASWRGPASNPGELPPLTKLAGLVQSLGLTPTTHTVIVSTGADTSDFGAMARIYWTLKVLGAKELSVLNGGLKAWSEANGKLDTAIPKIAASNWQPTLDTTWLATKQDVITQMKSNQAALIDARPADFYKGDTRHAAAKVNGTLKGATNLEHDKWFTAGSTSFPSVEQARKIAAGAAIDPARETISFCNTGHWAATNWFAMSEVLGHKNVKLYAGSMVEWTNDSAALPMDNVPGRLRQLVLDAQIWANRTFK